MIAGSFKFNAVVGVKAVDLIRAFGHNSAYKKARVAFAGFYREKERYTTLPGEIIDSQK